MDKKDLKIEFRAVPYSTKHVLEYRISPDQDIKYYKEHKWFWGLIKFKTVAKYSTDWTLVYIFTNTHISYLHTEDDDWNYMPIFIKDQNELKRFQYTYKTYGEFLKWYNDFEQKERAEYHEARNSYLNQSGIWN